MPAGNAGVRQDQLSHVNNFVCFRRAVQPVYGKLRVRAYPLVMTFHQDFLCKVRVRQDPELPGNDSFSVSGRPGDCAKFTSVSDREKIRNEGAVDPETRGDSAILNE